MFLIDRAHDQLLKSLVLPRLDMVGISIGSSHRIRVAFILGFYRIPKKLLMSDLEHEMLFNVSRTGQDIVRHCLVQVLRMPVRWSRGASLGQ